METIHVAPLNAADFAPFGDVIEATKDAEHFLINDGTTERFHRLATAVATGGAASVIISIARATPVALPLSINKVERHPDGSQAFMPLSPVRFLVIVAPDESGRPGVPQAFMARPGQGMNYRVGTWHSVLTALDAPTDFLIVDRAGDGDNLEVFVYPERYLISE